MAEKRVYETTASDILDLVYSQDSAIRSKAAKLFRNFAQAEEPVVKALVHLLDDDVQTVKKGCATNSYCARY